MTACRWTSAPANASAWSAAPAPARPPSSSWCSGSTTSRGGRILIDGQDIAQATQHSLRSQIAIVQQDPILFHRSLAENIAYGRPGASMAAIEQAARLANAHEFILRLPKGYGTLVGERGVKLSGGERQRVALARAFLADAPVLILDEATSSLDSESEALIQQAMERLMKGRTSIVIAHRLSTVRSLDRILVFDRGEIVEQGTHAVARQPCRRNLSRAVRAPGDGVRSHLGGGVRPGGTSFRDSFETRRFAMRLRMRSQTLMVRSASEFIIGPRFARTRWRVSNHGAAGKAAIIRATRWRCS